MVLIALTLLVTLVVARPTTAQTGWPSGDRDALVTLYNATDGPNWVNNTNWLSDEPLDTWYGVTTNAGGASTDCVSARTGCVARYPSNWAS